MITPTVICKGPLESECISIGNFETLAVGEVIYGDFYQQTALWQKVIYDGEVYYAPMDRINKEGVIKVEEVEKKEDDKKVMQAVNSFMDNYFKNHTALETCSRVYKDDEGKVS